MTLARLPTRESALDLRSELHYPRFPGTAPMCPQGSASQTKRINLEISPVAIPLCEVAYSLKSTGSPERSIEILASGFRNCWRCRSDTKGEEINANAFSPGFFSDRHIHATKCVCIGCRTIRDARKIDVYNLTRDRLEGPWSELSDAVPLVPKEKVLSQVPNGPMNNQFCGVTRAVVPPDRQ